LSSAESRPIAGVTTSGTPPAARSASVISMVRAAALSAGNYGRIAKKL
jgi:hypothetical protein